MSFKTPDELFTKTAQRVDWMFKWAPVLITVSALVGLGILGTLGYVAYHFLMKVW